MSKLAAIDVGSNAIRLAIASADDEGRLHIVQTDREAVRLGSDVFAKGEISDSRLVEAMDAFLKFRRLINQHKVKSVRAVGTSAIREARNRDYCINQIAKATEIIIEPISGEEEARLLYLATSKAVNLEGKVALLVDIGGGSVEITLATGREIIATESFGIGTVRLLQMLEQKKRGERAFRQLAREYINVSGTRLRKEIGERKVDLCIATGGNVESLGDLRVQLCDGRDDTSVSMDELGSILKELQSRSYEDRIKDFGLRPDRADVIIPATIVLQSVAKEAQVQQILIPRVGVREGLLIDMAEGLKGTAGPLHRTQVITSARLLGRKYDYEVQHALTVARFAVQLFDATKKLHKLGYDERTLLEGAALLHDIGYYIGQTDHHKHTYYLVNASPILGLDDTEKAIVANVARYHSRSFPKPNHKEYADLSPKRRQIVVKLAAILRLAEALDHEHSNKIQHIKLIKGKKKIILRLRGQGDLLLEKWALSYNSRLFQKVYKKKVVIE
ncbi:MAG: Ppx/GppA phosphatase family protein [Candidatus Bathyarchaeia archaeon]|jgi:exopolyphosphatase/guanosine-5'-triphosphate,3'-diphosphate pyrophosphatase